MAVAASQFYHLPLEGVKKALSTFAGVKRRLEVRAEINGITIVDDFGHHPTALRETLTALRRKYPQRRIWALFEPRSNTTRRAVFQNELPLALALADGVYISAIARPDQLPENDRLNPEQVAAYIRARGIPAQYGQDAQAIVDDLVPKLQAGDVVAVFTNGDFDGIHRRLEEALKAHGVQH
jgi:UDP-N-acetylmuramate: L-alanyl-gamma-D-glutamyl-meso-diaminopimelate ligase